MKTFIKTFHILIPMGEKKIGIAISLYDKFEELAVLIDIIRKNWSGKYILSVCSNHPNPEPHIKGLDIDVFTKGQDIVYNNTLKGIRKRVNIMSRVVDCIQKSCKGANNAGAEYVMHLHTDAWPLEEKKILEIIDYMEKNKKEVAFRGLGFSKYRHDCPNGHADDMFFIYNVKAMQEKRFLDFNPLAMLVHKNSIHGLLSLMLVSRIGIENTYHYDNHSNLLYWDGKKHPGDIERVKPSIFDPEHKFLHVHVQGFPEKYGLSVQAMYLKRYGLTKGEYIQKFIEKYYIPQKELFAILKKIEKKQNLKIRFLGFPILSFGRFGRTFHKKEMYIKASLGWKARYWFGATSMAVFQSTIGKIFGFEMIPDYSQWPESLESFYSRNLEEKDYPNKEIIWWKKQKSTKNKNKPVYRSMDEFR